MASDLIVFEIGPRRITVKDVMRSVDIEDLDQLATKASIHGSKLEALSYLAAYQIYRIFKRVEEAPDDVLRRAYRIFLWSGAGDGRLPEGSTGLRRVYNEAAHGWPSFDAWLHDWASGVPVSRSSASMKVHDIKAWREEGCGWPTILNLLASVPMAAREAMDKPVKIEALPPAPDTGEPSKSEYLKELTALPPGQARKKVSEDAGEPQIYCMAASYEWTQRFGKVLLLTIRLETSSEVVDYGLVVHPPEDVRRGWGAIAIWLSDRLGKRIKIG